MNKKHYNNVIDWTLKHDRAAQTEDSLATARAIFKNMGVALPNGSMQEVYDTIKTNKYMGWRACTIQKAQQAADKGTAAIGISKDRMVILAATDEEEPVTATASVMTLSGNNSTYAVDDLAYYAYSAATTNYGCGGEYRPINDYQVNCLEYALLLDADADIGLVVSIWDPKLNSSYFIKRIIDTIELNSSFTCRSIDAYDSPIDADEYRIAARVPHKDGYNYHFIYQLSDGTWAGKDNMKPSRHFEKENPSITPEMWSYDAYPPEAGTIYFAVKRG